VAQIAFTAVRLPYGWLGNMSPHPVEHGGFTYPTAEHLFQCWRFVGPARRWPGPEAHGTQCGYETAVREVRALKSPMAAKMRAKALSDIAVVVPRSDRDVLQMSMVLCLKFAQHPRLLADLLATGDADLVEDCSRRPSESGLFWGARRAFGGWVGENVLGKLLGGVRSVARLSGPSFVGAVMGPIVGDDLDALLAEVRLALPAVAK